MSVTKEYINDKKEQQINVYRADNNRIRADYNREQKYMVGYHGRELLEMIQNADDELIDELSKEILIKLDGDKLSVFNYGNPFNEEGLDSLMLSNLSGKERRKKLVIGNKGTGFRSILGWAQKVIIHSADMHVAFSEEYSNSFLREAIPYNEKVATLAFPEIIDEVGESGFTTEISLIVKGKDEIEDIKKQMNSINGSILLFLNRAEAITVDINGEITTYRKEESTKYTIVKKFINGALVNEENWVISHQTGAYDKERDYSVSVAYKADGSLPENQVLYSYFPTQESFPYPVLLHGTFELDDNRNDLVIGNPMNEFVLEKAAALMVLTAEKITKLRRVSNYDAISILIPDGDYSKRIKEYRFEEKLFEIIKASKLFPNVNDRYISLEDDAIYYASGIAKFLKGREFGELIKWTSEEKIKKYLKSLREVNILSIYDSDYLRRSINSWSKNRTFNENTIKENLRLMDELLFDDQIDEDILPRLTLTYNKNGKLVTSRQDVYISDGAGNEIDLPSFATSICRMNPIMMTLMQESIGSDSIYEVAEYYSPFNVKVFEMGEIIDSVNSIVEHRIKDKEYDKAKKYYNEMIRWLWENKSNIDNISPSVLLMSRNLELKNSDELYVGSEYGNHLTEELLASVNDDSVFVHDIRNVGIVGSDDDIIDFLERLGVAKFPRKREIDITITNQTKDRSYLDYVLDSFVFPLVAEDAKIYARYEITSTYYYWLRIVDIDVEYLDEILAGCDTTTVLNWIKCDKELYSLLFDKSNKNREYYIKWGRFSPRKITKSIVCTYLLWRFRTAEWVKVNGKRYSISNCILENCGDAFLPLLVQPNLDDMVSEVSSIVAKNKQKREYIDLLIKLGAYEYYSDLSWSQAYSLLDMLKEKDPEGKYAKTIYRRLINKSHTGINNNDFVESGYVYTNHGYQLVKNCFYLDKKGLCKRLLDNYNLIALPTRLSLSDVESVFGIKRLELKAESIHVKRIHIMNSAFQSDFQDYRVAAYCYRMDQQDELPLFKALNIVICSEVSANYNGEEIDLIDYDYATEDNRTFYLRIPSDIYTLEQLKNIDFGDAISWIICNMLDISNQADKFRSLYIVSESDRMKTVAYDYEDKNIYYKAKRELGDVTDVRSEFVGIVNQITNNNYDSNSALFEQIDFVKLNSDSNAEVFIKLFTGFNCDISDYNDASPSVMISVIPYFEKKMRSIKSEYYHSFRASLYKRLLSKSVEEQETYVDKVMNYDSMIIPIKDSVYYDVLDAFLSATNTDLNCDIDVDLIYKDRLNEFKSLVKDDGSVESFLGNNANRSLIYFGSFKVLKERYESRFENEKDYKEDHDPITPNKVTLIQNYTVSPIVHMRKGGNPKAITPGYKEESAQSKRNKKRIGALGEKVVFDLLNKKYGSVVWKSENAVDSGNNTMGSAGFGYDIQYIDDNGRLVYVEVKASSSKDNAISFSMSDREYEFALMNIDSYELYFVSDVKGKPRVFRLMDLFKNGAFNTDMYCVETETSYEVNANATPISEVEINT